MQKFVQLVLAICLVAVFLARFSEAVTATGAPVGPARNTEAPDCDYCTSQIGYCDILSKTCSLATGVIWQWFRNDKGQYQWHVSLQ
ncbi:hypothetical protein M8J75_000809 [Diaphorina citri]|nr:hypothetical protein M8J75_000809 [Diaphorina citri]